jgi:S1-C subfamily serine protease
MPSYGSIEVGVEVDAISKMDGPASRAGIKKGDIIKSIDGKPIKDIYEYMDRLGDLKRGMTVSVSIERDGEEMTLDVSF